MRLKERLFIVTFSVPYLLKTLENMQVWDRTLHKFRSNFCKRICAKNERKPFIMKYLKYRDNCNSY